VKPQDKDEFESTTRKVSEAGKSNRGLTLAKEEVVCFSESIKKRQPYDLLNIITVPLLCGNWWDGYRYRHPGARSKSITVTPEAATSYTECQQQVLRYLEKLMVADEGGSMPDVHARLIILSWAASVAKSTEPAPSFEPSHPQTPAFKKLQRQVP
jgi:hypothetical protein